jgi:hypothetical protein
MPHRVFGNPNHRKLYFKSYFDIKCLCTKVKNAGNLFFSLRIEKQYHRTIPWSLSENIEPQKSTLPLNPIKSTTMDESRLRKTHTVVVLVAAGISSASSRWPGGQWVMGGGVGG